MTQAEIEALPQAIQKLFGDLESRIMKNLVDRLKENQKITSYNDWLVNRSYQLGKSSKEIGEEI